MINHEKLFGRKSILAIERNFRCRPACSSVETLKGYMVKERLGIPDLAALPAKMSACNSYMPLNAYYPSFEPLEICCHVIAAQ